MSWLADTSGDARNNQVNRDGQQGGEDRSQSVLSATVLWHTDELLDDPTNEIIPAERRGEREARDNRVEGLRFEFLSHKVDCFDRGVHSE